MPAGDLPQLLCNDQAAWERWLEEHHAVAPGVWLQLARKDAGVASVSYDEAVEAALCYGWIDSQKRALDARFSLQRFTPRKAGSVWSAVNREKAQRLIAAGRMQPAGLRAIDVAKVNGRWDSAYAGQRTITVPDDLQQALDAEPEAAAFFATLSSANRYAVLYRVQTARRPETRAARIANLVAMLAHHETIHPQTPRSAEKRP
jgi:uncharacterized protein YdeI (YjbR/CyaY-like superfamily)